MKEGTIAGKNRETGKEQRAVQKPKGKFWCPASWAVGGVSSLGHSDSPGSDSGLNPDESVHAPQADGCLPPHYVAPHQSLEPHQTPQGLQSRDRLETTNEPIRLYYCNYHGLDLRVQGPTFNKCLLFIALRKRHRVFS